MNHVMVDLETLDTTADAVILSLGAVRFDLDSDVVDDAAFYASISIESNLQRGRSISESTLLWWMKQSQAAQHVFFEPKTSLDSALVDFKEWFDGAKYVWSNGADFDLPMLAHAFKQCGMETPWAFYDSRCVRTYKNLPTAKSVPKPNTGVKHNALSDALNQAKHVQAIHARLKQESNQ